ncbi:uncharacterized protein A4U43_C09F7580 [Asparagus officinalis]|uniref:Uncharacterized protein n=1 Tax=Asparagus officinalis TaxID=4686 RepID=A0A5P1E5Z1_ASPOF|nr:uncharacterized protein A4U43_C09F7580 [Asparagus officinalis]
MLPFGLLSTHEFDPWVSSSYRRTLDEFGPWANSVHRQRRHNGNSVPCTRLDLRTMSMLIIYVALLVKEVTVLVFFSTFPMASRPKASASKKKANDASSSITVPGHDPEPKPSDSANLQIHMEELEGAVKRVILAVDQGRGVFADLK